MFAVIVSGGKQYLVRKNDVIYVEKMAAEAGSEVVFDKVLMVDDKLGSPYITGASVVGTVEKHGKRKKILIIKHLSQEHHRRKHGHRQPYTQVRITDIKV